MMEASGLKILAIEDFNTAAKTVSIHEVHVHYMYVHVNVGMFMILFLLYQVVNVSKIVELANEVHISVDFSSY